MKLMNNSLLRVLLLWSTYIWISHGSTEVVHNGINKRNSRESLVLVKDDKSPLQVRPIITVDILIGKTTELQCENKTSKEFKWWQTPFGSFQDGVYNDKYPFEISGGFLKIKKATSSHTGLYYCHLVDNRGTTITPFRVNVMTINVQKARQRVTTKEYSDSHFAAAVASSVLVTFVGAFSIGAFSRPYLMKCWQNTKGKIGRKNRNHKHRNDDNIFKFGTNKQSLPSRAAFFRRGKNPEDDSVVFASPPPKPPNSLRSKPVNHNETQLQEHDTKTQDETDTTKTREAGEESEEPKVQDGEEQAVEQVSETDNQKQPKRRSRVIKVYNYDEEGNRYGHIKETETEDSVQMPRQRVMSLTRLNAIMSQVDSLDFSASRDRTNDTTKPDDYPTET